MTLILTCLTDEYILQVADRRVTFADGTLKDDDTTKAIWYCDRFAVAYTGPDSMEGKSTAEWIGSKMTDISEIEGAMKSVAEHAESHFRQTRPNKFAAVATGWGTFRGSKPLRPWIGVASNFMHSGKWASSPSNRVAFTSGFPLKGSPYFFFSAGQDLSPQDVARLKLEIGRAVKSSTRSSTDALLLARILGDTVQSIAKRNKKVGKGMITHLLPLRATLANQAGGDAIIEAGLNPANNSFSYVSSDGRTDLFQGAVQACDGGLETGVIGGSLPRRRK